MFHFQKEVLSKLINLLSPFLEDNIRCSSFYQGQGCHSSARWSKKDQNCWTAPALPKKNRPLYDFWGQKQPSLQDRNRADESLLFFFPKRTLRKTKTLLDSSAQIAYQGLIKVPLGTVPAPNMCHFRMMDATLLLKNLNSKFFCSLPLDLCLKTVPCLTTAGSYFNPVTWYAWKEIKTTTLLCNESISTHWEWVLFFLLRPSENIFPHEIHAVSLWSCRPQLCLISYWCRLVLPCHCYQMMAPNATAAAYLAGK